MLIILEFLVVTLYAEYIVKAERYYYYNCLAKTYSVYYNGGECVSKGYTIVNVSTYVLIYYKAKV